MKREPMYDDNEFNDTRLKRLRKVKENLEGYQASESIKKITHLWLSPEFFAFLIKHHSPPILCQYDSIMYYLGSTNIPVKVTMATDGFYFEVEE